MQGMWLRWFGQVMTREGGNCERQIMYIEVASRRKRGSLRTRWLDCIVADDREQTSDLGMAEDRSSWMRLIKTATPYRNGIIMLKKKRDRGYSLYKRGTVEYS